MKEEYLDRCCGRWVTMQKIRRLSKRQTHKIEFETKRPHLKKNCWCGEEHSLQESDLR
jgi:hypothetical protein